MGRAHCQILCNSEEHLQVPEETEEEWKKIDVSRRNHFNLSVSSTLPSQSMLPVALLYLNKDSECIKSHSGVSAVINYSSNPLKEMRPQTGSLAFLPGEEEHRPEKGQRGDSLLQLKETCKYAQEHTPCTKAVFRERRGNSPRLRMLDDYWNKRQKAPLL